MGAGEIITAIVLFVLAGVFLVLAVRHFMKRGFLMNNAYLFASKRERETMNKKPHYRQSAIAFLFVSAIFIVVGLSLVLENNKLLFLLLPLAAGATTYAIVSAIQIDKQERR